MWGEEGGGIVLRVRSAVLALRALDQVSHPPMQDEARVVSDANLLKFLNGGIRADGGQGGVVEGRDGAEGSDGKGGGRGQQQAKKREGLHLQKHEIVLYGFRPLYEHYIPPLNTFTQPTYHRRPLQFRSACRHKRIACLYINLQRPMLSRRWPSTT